MKSILNTQKYICYRCGRYGQTEVHHIFGAYNRKKSTEDGLVVNLCPDCHNIPPRGVHYDAQAMKRLRARGQRAYEEKMAENGLNEAEARETFMKRYGGNYL